MSEQQRAGADQPLVLLVDDEYGILEAVADLLRSEGFRVMPAGDGHEAMRALDADTPDVALVDVMMPGMNGIALVEAMGRDPRHRQVPVILMTAAIGAVPAAVLERVRLLRKPFLVDALLGALHEAVGRGSVAER